MNLPPWPPRWPSLLILLTLAATLLGPSPAEGRRRRRDRGRPAKVTPPGAATKASAKATGQPRTVVIYRRQVAAFAQVAEALKRRSSWAVVSHPLKASQAVETLREEVAAQHPVVVVALGPLAEQVAAPGVGAAAVVFTYRARPPATTVPRGGWLAQGAAPKDVLRWLARLKPGLAKVGMLLRGRRDPLEAALRRAAERRGVTPVFATVEEAGSPLRALVSLFQERPDAIWLGPSVEGWTASRLHAAVRLQALFRVPIVGVTREHVRAGLVLAVDSAPEAVAAALDRLLKAHVELLVQGGVAPVAARRRPRPGGRRPDARQLVSEHLDGRRVSLNGHIARALGLDTRAAKAAGALPVGP